MFSRLKIPLLVAPMAGGPSSLEFVVASSVAGALGQIGAAYLGPKEIEAFGAHVRARTDAPFAINLFIPRAFALPERQLREAVLAATALYRDELNLPVPPIAPPFAEDFAAQFEATLRARPYAISFVFGVLGEEYASVARAEKILLIGSATTVEEAIELADSGVDAVILQGFEAGGHRAIFDPTAADQELPLARLLDGAKAKLSLPLVAAGGLRTAGDIARVLAVGADAVQVGTAFLNCREAGTPAPYRRALEQPARRTRVTRAFSGRLARGIENRFLLEMSERPRMDFPMQNAFTRDLRAASLRRDSADFLPLWCGTGEGELFKGSVADLIARLFPVRVF